MAFKLSKEWKLSLLQEAARSAERFGFKARIRKDLVLETYLNNTCLACMSTANEGEKNALSIWIAKEEESTIKYKRSGTPAGLRERMLKGFLFLLHELCEGRKCSCGGIFIKKTNSLNGKRFFGCTNFPKCRNTKSL